MEHAPLLGPGIHAIRAADLDNHFLSRFDGSRTRGPLIEGLRRYLAAIERLGIGFEVWLDGSFLTEKIDPQDIDLVAFASRADIDALDSGGQARFLALFDRPSAKSTYGCDVLFAVRENFNARSYWRGWFGFDRNENPKGIACLTVGR